MPHDKYGFTAEECVDDVDNTPMVWTQTGIPHCPLNEDQCSSGLINVQFRLELAMVVEQGLVEPLRVRIAGIEQCEQWHFVA